MEVVALLLAGAGVLAALMLAGLTVRDKVGIVLLAAVVAAGTIFVMASDDWEMGPSWLVLAAVPLVGAVAQSYKAKSRRPL